VGKIAEAWQGWKNRYLKPNGMVVKDDGGLFNDTPAVQRPNCVSEGQAYGMLIAAQLGDKVTFDSIHNFNQTVLRRSVCVPSDPVAPSHIAYLYDPYKLVVTDAAGAPDADIDIALALIWAHEKWGSAGTINYQAKALEILADMKTYSFINYKGGKIIDGGTWNYPDGNIRDINPSYQSPGACKKFKDFTGDTFWDLARDGAYKIWKDSGDATLTGYTNESVVKTKTGAGVIPNWCRVNGANDQLTGPKGSNYSIDHSYDAFRAEHRGYWDYLWNPSTSGFQAFAAYKLKTIYENEFNAGQLSIAERSHDNIPGTNLYENPTFTSKHWMTMQAGGSTVANAFKAAKLNPTTQYKYHPTGSYFQILGYFGESWQIIYFMTQNNLWRYTNS
jgi:endo-1,4-beta-D-glucanase Y